MTPTNENGNQYAFPARYADGTLTKRELFAAMAMQGLISNPNAELNIEQLVAWSVEYADAFLTALSEGKG